MVRNGNELVLVQLDHRCLLLGWPHIFINMRVCVRSQEEGGSATTQRA